MTASPTFAAGCAFGGTTAGARSAIDLVTGHTATALVVATQNFADPERLGPIPPELNR